MELSVNKPAVAKSQLRVLKKNKWEHAEEVQFFFEELGLEVVIFEKSTATPHMRIDSIVDYWPASSRFYNHDICKWGVGFEQLKLHLIEHKQKIEEWQKDLDNDLELALRAELNDAR